jgi:hypothetical protein
MRPIRTIWTIMVVVPCATRADARTHRVPKRAVQVATKPDATIPIEKNRDPAEVALNRKIKRHLQRLLKLLSGSLLLFAS